MERSGVRRHRDEPGQQVMRNGHLYCVAFHFQGAVSQLAMAEVCEEAHGCDVHGSRTDVTSLVSGLIAQCFTLRSGICGVIRKAIAFLYNA